MGDQQWATFLVALSMGILGSTRALVCDNLEPITGIEANLTIYCPAGSMGGFEASLLVNIMFSVS